MNSIQKKEIDLFNSAAMKSILEFIPQNPIFRGLERIFQKNYELNVQRNWSSPNLSKLGLYVRCHGTNGKIDLYEEILKVGIELKVIKVNKKQLTPSTALYDIGQLSSDAIDLISCPKIIEGYLLILFVSDEALCEDSFFQKIDKKFKNDFKNSFKQRSENSNLRDQQRIIYERWNLDRNEPVKFDNFFVKDKLAIGIMKVK